MTHTTTSADPAALADEAVRQSDIARTADAAMRQAAVAAILAGAKVSPLADRLGVHRAQLYRWRDAAD